MEGRLRRTGEHHWAGELHGYCVYIGEQGGQWYVWLAPGGEWTERCLRARSFGHGRRAGRNCGGGKAKPRRRPIKSLK
jgi:hypothetical protein